MALRTLYRATIWVSAIGVPLLFGVPAGWYLTRTASQSPYCSSWKGLVDLRVDLGRDRVAHEIANDMRQVGTDQKLGLVEWETPDGTFWVPSGSPMLLAYLLAQQRSDIYGDQQAGVHSGDVVID